MNEELKERYVMSLYILSSEYKRDMRKARKLLNNIETGVFPYISGMPEILKDFISSYDQLDFKRVRADIKAIERLYPGETKEMWIPVSLAAHRRKSNALRIMERYKKKYDEPMEVSNIDMRDKVIRAKWPGLYLVD